eukprot:12869993-Ditylum_brightwellii.AAC.1
MRVLGLAGWIMISMPFILLLVLVLAMLLNLSLGKEIVATNKWQWVGPNNKVLAGLEIQMNFSSGGK